jgi:LisH domain-containing protein ARMC9
VLNSLVEHENLQVRTYVNGTLYSIFTRARLRDEAKQLGMVQVLEYLSEQSDE